MSDDASLEAAAAAAIWDELERQADRFGCVDRDWGFVDSRVDMSAVAAAVIEALGLAEERHTRNEYAARNGATPEVVGRRVSPWVAVDGSQP